MTSRPGLARCCPTLAAIGAGLDEIEIVLAAKEDTIERLTAENADLRAKLAAIVDAHNVTLCRLSELRAERGEPQ